jgi:S-adenosylmethionine:tRNA ribosyltransferase-isomerase
LTEAVLQEIRDKGAQIKKVDLVVGIDTFRPVTVDDPTNHVMHSESYKVDESTWEACQAAQRVVAIGTTTVRALESAARGALSGRTDLFLRRGSKFEIVDALMTNFHMPRSTLLMMIDAFIGQRWKNLYWEALENNYRFLSFGDAMFMDKTPS